MTVRARAHGSDGRARQGGESSAPRRLVAGLSGVLVACLVSYWVAAPSLAPDTASSAPRANGTRTRALAEPVSVGGPRRAPPTPRSPAGALPPAREAEPEPELVESEAPVEREELDEPLPTPPSHRAEADAGEAEPPAAVPAVPNGDMAGEDLAPQPPAHPPLRQRQLNLRGLRRWRQRGMCPRTEEADQAHRTLMTHFRRGDLAFGMQLYVDPRLPPGAELPVLTHLEEAERILQAELQLSPGLPDIFLYQDTELLLAAACTNADVVAYYDGALHIVATRDDVRESVLHELTHHALMTAGLLGPAWAQEGIAMHVARESWWQRRDLLERVIERPFSLTAMETIVPYTLETEQAVLFYVQAAAMVACATRGAPQELAGLVGALRGVETGDLLRYELPALVEPSAWRGCAESLR